jgi:hypothetical protein
MKGIMSSWIELRSCVCQSRLFVDLLVDAVRTSLTSSALCNGFSSAGLVGKDVMIAENIQWLYKQ